MEDFVVTRSGAQLGRLDHIFKDAVHVREAQIVQQKAGHMTVRVVKTPAYTESDHRALLQAIGQRVGEDVGFEVVYLDEIPRTASGKLRFVVSHLCRTLTG
jgi:phenylacetate-CoA ligase